jgi:APA family basic amino acid/polyamine antiporter
VNKQSSPTPARHGQLLRVLGVGFAFAVGIGGTIGLGILRSPAIVAGHAGSPGLALALWLLGGLYALLGAAAYADLATSIPRSGGVYVFAREALGDRGGFTFGWADLFATFSAIAFAALGFTEFSALLLPVLQPWAAPLAAVLVVVFTLGQLLGVRVSSVVQQLATAIKALAFLGLIAGLLLFAPTAPSPATTAPPAATGITGLWPGIAAVIVALQLVLGAYDGWSGSAYFAGEDKSPARNLPRAMLGSVLLVMLVYLLMNVALLRVLPFEVLAASPLPAADAARAWLGEAGAQLITAIAALSLLPLLWVSLMIASRITHAMASDGLLPAALGNVDARGTPVPALLFTSAATLLMIAGAGGVLNVVIGVSALLAIVAYSGGFLSLLVLRRREPQAPRSFASWGFPWTTGIVLAVAVGLALGVVASAPGDSMVAVIVMALTWPIYALTRREHSPPRGAATSESA